jgi:hypothetical protein
MSRTKGILTVTLILAVVALYLYVYRDAYIRHPIQISHTFRMSRAMARRLPKSLAHNFPLIPTFDLSQPYRLTSVKVVPLDELKSKGFAHPLWELVSASNSPPTTAFFYGRPIQGMHPKIAGTEPDPLVTNVTYRILVTAGRLKGQHDFTITAADLPPEPTPPADAN